MQNQNENEEYWCVKRCAYACVCITPNGHGSVTIWDTSEEAWKDALERAEELVNERSGILYYNKVYDGYEVWDSNTVVRYYKVFEAQELE